LSVFSETVELRSYSPVFPLRFRGLEYSDRAAGWMTGIRFPVGVGIFLFVTASRPALGPPSLLWIGYWCSILPG